KVVASKVQELNDALLKGDYARIADLTHAKVIESTGGRDKMIEQMKTIMKQLKDKGVEVVGVKLEPVADPVKGSDGLYIVAPFELEMKVPDGKMRSKTFVIGVSPDQGKNWTFVNGDLDIKQVKQMLPNLPAELKLPERQVPKIEKN